MGYHIDLDQDVEINEFFRGYCDRCDKRTDWKWFEKDNRLGNKSGYYCEECGKLNRIQKSADAEVFWQAIGDKGRTMYIRSIKEDEKYINYRWEQIPKSIRQELAREMNQHYRKPSLPAGSWRQEQKEDGLLLHNEIEEESNNKVEVEKYTGIDILHFYHENEVRARRVWSLMSFDDRYKLVRSDKISETDWVDLHIDLQIELVPKLLKLISNKNIENVEKTIFIEVDEDESVDVLMQKKKFGWLASLLIGAAIGGGGYIAAKKVLGQLMSGGVSLSDAYRLLNSVKGMVIDDKQVVYDKKAGIITFLNLAEAQNNGKMSKVSENYNLAKDTYYEDLDVFKVAEEVKYANNGSGMIVKITDNYATVLRDDGSAQYDIIHLNGLMRTSEIIYTKKYGMCKWNGINLVERQHILAKEKIPMVYQDKDWNLLPRPIQDIILAKYGRPIERKNEINKFNAANEEYFDKDGELQKYPESVVAMWNTYSKTEQGRQYIEEDGAEETFSDFVSDPKINRMLKNFKNSKKKNEINKAKSDQEEVNLFLDALRASGVTNMFGAGRYIEDEFGVEPSEARGFLSEWMKTFGQRHPNKIMKHDEDVTDKEFLDIVGEQKLQVLFYDLPREWHKMQRKDKLVWLKEYAKKSSIKKEDPKCQDCGGVYGVDSSSHICDRWQAHYDKEMNKKMKDFKDLYREEKRGSRTEGEWIITDIMTICNICNKEFPDGSGVVFHIYEEHPEQAKANKANNKQEFSCPYCHDKFGDKAEYDDHAQAHKDKCALDFLKSQIIQLKKIKCGTCKREGKINNTDYTIEDLADHVISAHSDIDDDEYDWGSIDHLKSQIIELKKEIRYVCHTCGKKFTEVEMQRHFEETDHIGYDEYYTKAIRSDDKHRKVRRNGANVYVKTESNMSTNTSGVFNTVSSVKKPKKDEYTKDGRHLTYNDTQNIRHEVGVMTPNHIQGVTPVYKEEIDITEVAHEFYKDAQEFEEPAKVDKPDKEIKPDKPAKPESVKKPEKAKLIVS